MFKRLVRHYPITVGGLTGVVLGLGIVFALDQPTHTSEPITQLVAYPTNLTVTLDSTPFAKALAEELSR